MLQLCFSLIPLKHHLNDISIFDKHIIGESVLRIKELQRILVHDFGFDWMFVYDEWASIVNSK